MEIRPMRLHRQRCSKCGGNVCLAADQYGPYLKCLQCGKTWEIVESKRPAREPVKIA